MAKYGRHFKLFGYKSPEYSGGGGAVTYYPLDDYTASFAFALRKIKTGQTASNRIRRSSDNTESDIGVAGDDWDSATAITFVAGSSGYVVSWVDITGNGITCTQVTTGQQGRIINAGVLVTINGKAAVDLTVALGCEYDIAYTAAQPHTAFAVAEQSTASEQSLLQTQLGAGTQRAIYTTPGGVLSMGLGNTLTSSPSITPSAFAGSANLFYALMNGASSEIGMNEVYTSGDAGTNSYGGAARWGSYNAATRAWQGHIMELINFATNQSANKAAISAKISPYYGI